MTTKKTGKKVTVKRAARRMHTLVIDRRKWLRNRGTEVYDSMLLDPKGKMCCLGFACLDMGMKRKDIKDITSPSVISCIREESEEVQEYRKSLGWLLRPGSSFNSLPMDSRDCNRLMMVNDSPTTTDKMKEHKITRIFAKHSVKVKFIN